jgi:hypothetical protein
MSLRIHSLQKFTLEYYCFESNDVFEEAGKSNEKNNDKEKKVPETRVDNENDEILKQYLVVMQNNNQPSTVKGIQSNSLITVNLA